MLPVAPLPPMLNRPSDVGAIAHLTYEVTEENDKGQGGPRWRLKGSSAVVELAQRLFAGALVAKDQRGISWPAAPATFDDLLMLMHRFPVSIGASARAAWSEQYDDLLASYYERMAPPPEERVSATFKGVLREFQAEGLKFMRANRKCVLGDDMGLGKTPQGLALLASVEEWPALIVCQSHVMTHWARSIEKFLDANNVRSLKGRTLTWCSLRDEKPSHSIPKAHIYLVHYLIIAKWRHFLETRGIKVILFDECQELRHLGTGKSDACRALAKSARRVVGLSGTPIYNKGIETYHVWDSINRGCLGTKVRFQLTWCDEHDTKLVMNPDALGTWLRDRGLYLRRNKQDVALEMPGKQKVIEPIDGDNKKFQELLKEAVRLVREADQSTDKFERGRKEAEALAKTRQATGIAKAPSVVAFLRALLEAEQPTIVFAHHLAVHEMISRELAAFSPVRITGQETTAQKDLAVRSFVAGETNLCQIALRAATGIDGLQHRGRVVVFAEFDWAAAIHWQAEDRLYRMGQKESVLVYYLTTTLGTDPGMMEVLAIKEEQALGLMHEKMPDENDALRAAEAAERHKQTILEMLRGQRM